MATAVMGLNGLFMLTLAVTYLLAIIEAVVAKRSFASQVWSLGRSAEEFIIHSWSGRGFPSQCETPPPRLERLRDEGIPVVDGEKFAKAIAGRETRRRLLRGFLESERRDWP